LASSPCVINYKNILEVKIEISWKKKGENILDIFDGLFWEKFAFIENNLISSKLVKKVLQ
jgi:hypothetical protein